MQSSRFFGMLLCAAMIFLFTSCNNEESKTSADAAKDSTAAKSSDVSTAPVNTPITTPQGMLLIQMKVGNFDKWLESYEANDSMRLANGIHKYVIGRGVQDPNTLFIAMKVDDIAKAKEYSKLPALKQRMQKSGVVGTPTFSYSITTYQDTSTLTNSTIRSRTTFTVKDWNNWETVFQKNKLSLAENGLVLRAYGHDADDDKKVSLVTAVLDTAKATAYWKSDLLKQRRAESGVTSEPTRFLYQVAKLYR